MSVGTAAHTPQQTAPFTLIHLIFRSKLILAFNNRCRTAESKRALHMADWSSLALESGAPDRCDFPRAKASGPWVTLWLLVMLIQMTLGFRSGGARKGPGRD